MEQVLLYEDTKKLPGTFSQADIEMMFQQIDVSPDYLKTVWGEWMKARDKAILATIYILALRPGEACGLRFDDFNFKDGTVLIRGENNKVKKDRVIPLPPDLIPFYQNYLKFSRARFWKGSPYLFPSAERQHIAAGHWKFIMREKILKPLGLWEAPVNSTVPKFRSYTLRHTRASELLNKYKDIFLVANVLGHAKLNSTKIYVHTSENYQEYMRNALTSIKYPEGGEACKEPIQSLEA